MSKKDNKQDSGKKESKKLDREIYEAAMFEMQAQITTIIPGETPCLSCIYPEDPPGWKRRFPVFGAVSGTVGCMAAMEAIKVLSNLGEPLKSTLMSFDLRDMSFLKMPIFKKDDCEVCGE